MQYYTDPVSHHVFRTLKSVLSYLQTGEISKHAYVPRKSVTDMYSFDKCADLVIAFSCVVFVLVKLHDSLRKMSIFGFLTFLFHTFLDTVAIYVRFTRFLKLVSIY